jgi:predicted metal-binding membrane protein
VSERYRIDMKPAGQRTKAQAMTPAARERSVVRTPVLCIAAVAWLALVAESLGAAIPAHCASRSASAPSLAAGWALMLAAMMAPLLIAPARHVYRSSFARRRTRALGLFVAAYGAVWMAAGVALLALARLAPSDSYVPAAVALAIAIAWQFSPVKQRALNRCHAHRALAAFGQAADIDALRFGWTHGVWCVCSCWALMLLPLLTPVGHLAAMGAVSLWMFAERLETPKPPHWRLRVPMTAARMLAAQTRIVRLKLTTRLKLRPVVVPDSDC